MVNNLTKFCSSGSGLQYGAFRAISVLYKHHERTNGLRTTAALFLAPPKWYSTLSLPLASIIVSNALLILSSSPRTHHLV